MMVSNDFDVEDHVNVCGYFENATTLFGKHLELQSGKVQNYVKNEASMDVSNLLSEPL